mmetsp:Transcript_24576/g.41197  ORF Transcript_24576/g.41197 Transcript_24576/m.41197 type:complete len:289 (-) Transcript_24576:60-926(-)
MALKWPMKPSPLLRKTSMQTTLTSNSSTNPWTKTSTLLSTSVSTLSIMRRLVMKPLWLLGKKKKKKKSPRTLKQVRLVMALRWKLPPSTTRTALTLTSLSMTLRTLSTTLVKLPFPLKKWIRTLWTRQRGNISMKITKSPNILHTRRSQSLLMKLSSPLLITTPSMTVITSCWANASAPTTSHFSRQTLLESLPPRPPTWRKSDRRDPFAVSKSSFPFSFSSCTVCNQSIRSLLFFYFRHPIPLYQSTRASQVLFTLPFSLRFPSHMVTHSPSSFYSLSFFLSFFLLR